MNDQVDAIVGRAQVRLEAIENARDGLNRLVGTAHSPDGRITAQVDGSGALVDLRLAESVCSMESRALAAAILTTVHEAAQIAGARRVAVMNELGAALQ